MHSVKRIVPRGHRLRVRHDPAVALHEAEPPPQLRVRNSTAANENAAFAEVQRELQDDQNSGTLIMETILRTSAQVSHEF